MVDGADWTTALEDSVPEYVLRLSSGESPGRFLPCLEGTTALGRRVALGFSCFALKLYTILRLWEPLEANRKAGWIQFVQSFQVGEGLAASRVFRGAFVDPAVVYAANTYWRYPRQLFYHAYSYACHPRALLRDRLGFDRRVFREQVILAETKQAIATLRDVGVVAHEAYRGIPLTAAGIRSHLSRLEWTRPWHAGGQASALAMLVAAEAPRFLDAWTAHALALACGAWFEEILDGETGAYFRGPRPRHNELVNGAMKVLTALDWLNVPIHRPERLIETCLMRPPSPAACDVVDAVYVLYRCGMVTTYRQGAVQSYCRQALDLIRRHHNRDGGFSYQVGRSQTGYYGVQITRGLAVSDLHGTLLMAWAVAMIVEILERNTPRWRVIRP
ncbi:MAG TPA: hypothetical protein VMO26_18165 [Vicinamibacterales bacterium]|nr:hypothetical protein [Vicinamibacterales bacterium]